MDLNEYAGRIRYLEEHITDQKARNNLAAILKDRGKLLDACKTLSSRMVMKTFPHEPTSMWCDLWEWEEFCEAVGLED